MSNEIFKAIKSAVVEVGLTVCWAQWSALGSYAADARGRRVVSIIDPEALILLSLFFEKEERRLGDMLVWWSAVGSRLTSVQRLSTLGKKLPPEVQTSVGRFASLAYAAGDRRWSRMAIEGMATAPARRLKGPSTLSLTEASTLMLRLRAALGVGSKADTLTFLLGIGDSSVPVSAISHATAYTQTAIRTAAQDMALGRLIRETQGRPVLYFVTPKPWTEIFEIERQGPESTNKGGLAMPSWQFWADIGGFLIAVMEWADRSIQAEEPYEVSASKARDIIIERAGAFNLNRIPMPDPNQYRGEEFLIGVLDTVGVLSRWIRERI